MRIIRIALVVAAAFALWACGGIKPSLCATGEQWVQGQGCVCLPGHVPDADGKGCHVPDPVPTPTPSPTPTPKPTPTPTPTPVPTPVPTPTPSPSPSPSPSPGQPAGCYAGPWRFHCRFPSCEIQGEPSVSLYESVIAESVARLKVAGEIPESQVMTVARKIEADLQAHGYCAATHDDPANRVSDDEVAVWETTNPRPENLDFCRATGATPGFCVVLERPFMVARGIP